MSKYQKKLKTDKTSERPRETKDRDPLETTVPRLRYGRDTNLLIFKQKLGIKAMQLYGNLARFIETDQYYEPERPDPSHYELGEDDDPHGFNREEFRALLKEYTAEKAQMNRNKPQIYAFIYSYLSNESVDEVKKHERYAEFHLAKDPLELWLAIKETHKTGSTATNATVSRLEIRQRYKNLAMGKLESIVSYKERFDDVLEAYMDAGHETMSDEDIAMDFFNGLDKTRYSEFQTLFLNGLTMGSQQQPDDLNAMYQMASKFILPKPVMVSTTNAASFNVQTEGAGRGRGRGRGRGGRGEGKKPDKADAKETADKKPSAEEAKPSKKKEPTCWNCGEPGHKSYECTVGNDERTSHATSKHAFSSSRSVQKWNEVMLDNQSDTSIINAKLIENIRPAEQPVIVSGVSGKAGHSLTLDQVGDLRNFFEVYTSEYAKANVLCMADVEDKYNVTYEKGPYTSRMDL